MAHAYRVGLLLAGVLTSACFDPGEGVEPPLERVYFPVGLAVDADASHLFVVNSDFDLQFNGGTVQSYNLGRLRGLVPHGDCGALGAPTPESQVMVPGACGFLDPQNPPDGLGSLIQSAVGIGALAVDVLFRARPNDVPAGQGPPGRLYVPVRGDTTLHFIDVEPDGTLQCGQANNDGDCDDAHRRGDDPAEENIRGGLRLPPEPFGIAASEDGHAIAVTHQTEGAVSLFVDTWTSEPDLEFVAGNMPARPTGIVGVPEAQFVSAGAIEHQPGFLVTFRDAAEVRLLRFFDDAASAPQRPYLQVTNGAEIRVNTAGFDSRGVAIDASERKNAEADCAAIVDPTEQTECLRVAAAVPLGVYVANRTPASLIVGETRVNFSPTSSDDVPDFFNTLPLDFGPSRVVVGEVINRDGEREPRVFAVCFDSRVIYVFDPVSERIETAIETGRGPHAFAVDVTDDHAFGYVGSFTDSYIAVIGLDQRKTAEYGKLLLNVAEPTPPRASK